MKSIVPFLCSYVNVSGKILSTTATSTTTATPIDQTGGN